MDTSYGLDHNNLILNNFRVAEGTCLELTRKSISLKERSGLNVLGSISKNNSTIYVMASFHVNRQTGDVNPSIAVYGDSSTFKVEGTDTYDFKDVFGVEFSQFKGNVYELTTTDPSKSEYAASQSHVTKPKDNQTLDKQAKASISIAQHLWQEIRTHKKMKMNKKGSIPRKDPNDSMLNFELTDDVIFRRRPTTLQEKLQVLIDLLSILNYSLIKFEFCEFQDMARKLNEWRKTLRKGEAGSLNILISFTILINLFSFQKSMIHHRVRKGN